MGVGIPVLGCLSEIRNGRSDVAVLYVSSFVFVGNFPENMFDERELFGGRIDPGGRIHAGPVLQCAYAGGVYQFHAVPDRIDLRANTPNIMPETLVEAVQFIVKQLDPLRRAVNISGFGMNCDTTIDQHLIRARGRDYCFNLLARNKIRAIVDTEITNSLTRVQFVKDAVHYNVRIEPHFQSDGNNLFVAVNGHQNINAQDSLGEKLQHTDAFKEYVEGLHRRILKD